MERLPSGPISPRPKLKLLATCTVINVLKGQNQEDLEGNTDPAARPGALVDERHWIDIVAANVEISRRNRWLCDRPGSENFLDAVTLHGRTLSTRPDLPPICHAVAGPSHCWRELALIIASRLRAGTLNDDHAESRIFGARFTTCQRQVPSKHGWANAPDGARCPCRPDLKRGAITTCHCTVKRHAHARQPHLWYGPATRVCYVHGRFRDCLPRR
jgi:hypothetical protein